MVFIKSLVLLTALSAVGALAQEAKQLFHVTAAKSVFDSALASFGSELDVWEVRAVPDTANVKADIYATSSVINQFFSLNASTESSIYELQSETPTLVVQRDAVDMPTLIKDQAEATASCKLKTANHLSELAAATTNYVDNAFFDCWRTADEVFAFFDTLVTANPSSFSKIASVSTTYEKRTIPAYKISTGAGKSVVYVQGLIHAREWHAGSTGFYAIASLLDGLRNGDATIKALVAKYDWVFVPIVNLDGYLYTYATNGNRLWRKNRRPISGSTYGVDLNRNYGPAEYFGLAGDSPSSDTYPGSAAYSEPETAGLNQFLKTLKLAGFLDIHSYSGLVLRPFGNQENPAPAPYGAKLKTLGDSVKNAIQTGNSASYSSETVAQLYLSYGGSIDALFLEFNKTAALAFEMEGSTFTPDASVIRPGGKHIFQGILTFAQGLAAYYA